MAGVGGSKPEVRLLRSSAGLFALGLSVCLAVLPVALAQRVWGAESKMSAGTGANDYAEVATASRGLPGTIVNNSLQARIYGARSLGGGVRLYPLKPGHSSPAYARALFLLPAQFKPLPGSNGVVFLQQLAWKDLTQLKVVAVEEDDCIIIAADGKVLGGTAKPVTDFVPQGQGLSPETETERYERHHELAVSTGGGTSALPPPAAVLRPCGCLNPCNIPSTIGINLGPVMSQASEFPFNDVFKTARLIDGRHDGDASYVMCAGLDGHYPAGTYTVKWQGTGHVALVGDGKDAITQASDPEWHGMQVAVNPTDQGLKLVVTGSSPKDPIRDIHVYFPGMEKDGIFARKFLKFVQPFSVLRFADWGATNNSPVKAWEERSHVDDPLWSTNKGVPLEVMIELCNASNKNGWFCIPARADDRYVAAFAQMLRDKLKGSLSAYVEYANEVWSPELAPGQYARQAAKAENLTPEQFYARRAVHIGDICHSILGTRAIPVLSSKFTDPAASDAALAFEQAYKHVAALAIAPYFGINPATYPGGAQAIDRMDVHTLELALTSALASNLELVKEQIAVAQKYRLPVVAYAGGQQLTPQAGDPVMKALFANIDQDPAMARLYDTYFHNWFSAGGFLFMHGFIPASELDRPKHDVAVQYAAATTH